MPKRLASLESDLKVKVKFEGLYVQFYNDVKYKFLFCNSKKEHTLFSFSFLFAYCVGKEVE